MFQTFGDGCVAQSVLSKGVKGEFLSINWGWAVAVMMGVYVTLVNNQIISQPFCQEFQSISTGVL